MVMLVLGEVLGKMGNALSKHSYLETGRAGILLINFELVNVDITHSYRLLQVVPAKRAR